MVKKYFKSDLQRYIHISKYARWIEKEKRRETWEESVDRFIKFWKERNNCGGGIGDAIYDNSVLEEIKEAILNHEVMPSMRCMMTAGKALEHDNIAGYNCTASAIMHPAIFSEAFYILMNGCGFGFSCERQYINKMPEIAEELYPTETTIIVKDSKIGWATGLKELISMLYNGQIPKWDLSLVRPAGARLKTFGGRASGPEPLDRLFHRTVGIFRGAKGRKLNSIECHDLMCFIAETVIVGSVRRAALISLSNLTDDRMRRAKDGQWWLIDPQRALANNSVAYTEKPDLDSFSKEWRTLYKSKSGERGIWNKEGAKKIAIARGREHDGDYIPNPSLRGNTKVWTDTGIYNIKDLENKLFNVRNKNNEIVSAECWKSAENLQLWNLELKGNHTYQCSPQHKWVVLTGKDKTNLVKKRADEINPGDILLKNGFHDNISSFESKENDRNLGFLIGWNIGDGWKTIRSDDNSTQYGFIVSDEDKKENIDSILHEILKKECDWNGSFLNKNEINVNNKKLNDIFDGVGFIHKKEGLPQKIWNECGEEKIRGIIDGLFSSDGCVSSNSITLKTSNLMLASDVSELLGFYGITNSIYFDIQKDNSFPNGVNYNKEYYSYTVGISGYLDIVHFHNIFKLTHNSKEKKVIELIENNKLTYHFNDGILVKDSYLSEEYDDVYDITVHDDTATFQLAHSITGNCGEVSLRDDGGVCNLTECMIRPYDTFETIKKKIRLATIMGTIQSTLTDFRFLRKIWKKNADEERLLGVSLTGIMDHPVFSGVQKDASDFTGDGNINTLPLLLKHLHDYAHEVNKEWADILGINATGHVCVIKPSGTVSLLTDTSSGIHTRYNRWIIRRVRNDKKDPLSQLMIEEGIPYVDDGDKYVFSFFVESPEHSVLQKDMGAMQQLEVWKIYKENWCDGNPSQTIYYTDDDYFAIADWLWKNWDAVGGLSFFPYTDASEGVYKNAPLEAITKEEYDKYIETFPKDINWDRLREFEKEDKTETAMTLACSNGGCELT